MRDAYTIGKLRDPQKKLEALQDIRKWSQDMADAKVGRERQKAFLQYAQQQVRENYIFNQHVPQMNYQTADERAFSQNFAPFINDGNVQQIMEELDKAEQQITQNGNAKIIFFDLCLQFIVLLKR
jgi:DNA polymerase-3 subunit delta'